MRERWLGHVPLFTPYHSGSETFYGINFDLQNPDSTFTVMAPFNFLEFIPVERIDDPVPPTCLCDEVKYTD